MKTQNLLGAQWRKSSRSTDTGGDCVEIAALTSRVPNPKTASR